MSVFLQRILFGILLLAASGTSIVASATETPTTKNGVIVTDANFIHADSVRAYINELSQTKGKVNVIRPARDFANTDTQDVIRMNSDTLYTRIILDVKGGATISTKDYLITYESKPPDRQGRLYFK